MAPLTNGRHAVALFNRSPSPDTIVLTADMLGVPSTATFAAYDVWADAAVGPFSGNCTVAVQSQAVAYLVLTPS